ncbi:hypothetical protein ACJW31_04G094900 [Castanea mollissima]
MPPAYSQRPLAPPPPPPHFQQGLPAPPPPINPQAPPTVRPHVGNPVPHIYHQHGPPAPLSTMHQGPPGGMLNTGQSYLQIQGSAPLPLTYSSTQQNSQHQLHLGTQNVHHAPPTVPPPPPPPGPPHSEILQAPPPPRVLPPPPPPPHGQTLYRAPLHPPQRQPSAVQGLQQMSSPPPPPSTSGFSSYASSMVPPPPPSSPPPIPPSPPPLTSSLTSSSTPNKVRHDTPAQDGYLNHEGGSGFEVGPLAGDGVSSSGSAILDFPPPPPKPTEEKVVQNIEGLCQLIAKNGNGIEDLTRHKEARNPEFAFLFGGESGSEAAIAHKYFLWMKKKCVLAYKIPEGQGVSPSRTLKIESSMQSEHLNVGAGCDSPSDSDMEMEDDFTQADKDQGVNHSIEGLNNEYDLIHKKLDVKEHLHVLRSIAEGSPMTDASSVKVTHSGSLELGEQGLHNDNSTFGSSISEVPGASECLVSGNFEKSSTLLSNDMSPSKTSTAAVAINSDKCSSEVIKGGSPFRLLQDYASDDSSENDDEPRREVGSALMLSASVTDSAANSHRDAGCNLGTDESKSSSRTEKGSGLLSKSNMPYKASEISPYLQKEVKDTGAASISSGTTDEHVDYNHKNKVSISHAVSPEAVREKDDLGSAGNDVSKGAISKKKNKEKKEKLESAHLKVDEFGRLIKEGGTDSDNEDSRYTRRHNKRGRSRSRSRSQSPVDRRRRRSPRRRRERRSRSRSWSPRKRRSRSRSPLSRRAGENSAENLRRGKGQIPECFDFRRGRCYRGASCRFMHNESERTSGSRHQKSKQQYLDVPPSAKNSKFREDDNIISGEVSNPEHEAFKSQEMQPCEETIRGAKQSGILDNDDRMFNSDAINSESSVEVSAKVQEMHVVQDKPEQPTTDIPDGENHQGAVDSCQPLSVDGFPSQSVSNAEALKSQGLQNADCPSQLMDDSSLSDSPPDLTSMTSSNKFSTREPFPNMKTSTQPGPDTSSISQPLSSEQFPLQPLAPKESSPSISAMGLPHHPSESHPPPVSQGVNSVHMPQLPNYLIPQSASFPFQSAPGESFHPYQAPLHSQHSQYSVPPMSSWTSLPPPPPRPLYDSTSNAGTATTGVSSQFQESHMLAFGSQTSVRHYPSNMPSYVQVGEFPYQTHPPGQEPQRPLLYAEDFRSNPPPMGNPDLISSSSFAPGNMHSQPMPSSHKLFTNQMQPFSGDNLPPGEHMKPSSQIHPYSQQHQPPYGLQYPATDSILGVPGTTGSVSRYTPDLVDGKSSQHPDFGGSRISAHYNPYASTFEQPLSTKFSSDVFKQEKDTPYSSKYDSSLNLSHLPVDGLGVGSVTSRQTTSSPSSTKAVRQILPRSGGDQYDPLFDSIEPSSKSQRKYDHGQKQELTGDSDTILRLSGTRKPLDVEEKHKEVGAVASTTSLDNDEYGETADAEVGAVENDSPSDPLNVPNMTQGEIEIDQIKSSGKSKKSKDSRSMKLFKIAVADFVKEVLKPSWRQGNMSKEAFKTIVKKTVDKVSGAMKSHQIPKSQTKIDQYIDSSQRKLTKLVMGYVDKYVKV